MVFEKTTQHLLMIQLGFSQLETCWWLIHCVNLFQSPLCSSRKTMLYTRYIFSLGQGGGVHSNRRGWDGRVEISYHHTRSSSSK